MQRGRSSRFGGVVPLAGWRHHAPSVPRGGRDSAHHSPNHGSWLNIAGVENSVVARNCLVRPCPNLQTLAQRTAALGAERDAQWHTVSWQFTTTQARKRVHRLCLDPKT